MLGFSSSSLVPNEKLAAVRVDGRVGVGVGVVIMRRLQRRGTPRGDWQAHRVLRGFLQRARSAPSVRRRRLQQRRPRQRLLRLAHQPERAPPSRRACSIRPRRPRRPPPPPDPRRRFPTRGIGEGSTAPIGSTAAERRFGTTTSTRPRRGGRRTRAAALPAGRSRPRACSATGCSFRVVAPCARCPPSLRPRRWRAGKGRETCEQDLRL